MNQIQDSVEHSPAGEDVDVTQAVSVPTVERTAMSANVECPVCRTPNAPSESYCIDCGFVLGEEPIQAEGVEDVPFHGSLSAVDGVREFMLKPGENTVGRENSDVPLTHKSVSRLHAVITVEQDRVKVTDVGSTNGTVVDGSRIEPDTPVEVKDGAELRFGDEVLTYKAPSHAGHGDQTDYPDTSAEATVPNAGAEPAVGIVGRLVAKDGSTSYELACGVHTIGRRPGENDILVADPYASGRHADIEVAEGSVVITDVGSSNGTTVNGVRIEPNTRTEIKSGDEIGIGQTAFRLEFV